MPFCNIEYSVRLEEMCDNLAPALQIWQPAQYSIGGEDNIKLSREHIREIIYIRADKVRIYPQLFTQCLSLCDRLLRKINACDFCTQPGPCQRIHSEVA